MRLLAFDTATPATVVGVRTGDVEVERRHDPGPGERPGHVSQLLALASAALAEAGLRLGDVDRVGVGVGPGTFTGLRIGVSTARALAQATRAELVAVSTLQALAVPGRPTLCVLDARRGEAFVAAWHDEERLLAPTAVRPDAIPLVAPLAVGDGAVRFREHLEAAGAEVPDDASPLHRVTATALCRLAARAPAADPERLVPDYVRDPDAVPRR